MSGRGRARGRARGAPATQPTEPARRPGQTGPTAAPPGRGRARGAPKTQTQPQPQAAAVTPAAAAAAEPPTQQMAAMGISQAARGPRQGAGEQRGGRRRRDEEERVDTRPANRENKIGSAGRQVDIVANYFPLKTRPEWRIYQYAVEFNPDIQTVRMKRGLLHVHQQLLGATNAFDGRILYLTMRLEQNPTELASTRITDGSIVNITITLTAELPPTSPQLLPMFNVVFRRVLSKLGMQQIQRHYFSASEKDRTKLPAHRLEIWPGYATAIGQYEHRVMLCADVAHKVLRTETVWDVIHDISKSKPPNFRDAVFKKLVGSIVMTRYNNKTYRVEDINWDVTPRHSFKKSKGEDITYVEYYQKNYGKTLSDMSQPMLVSKSRKKVPTLDGSGRTVSEPVTLNLIPELCTMTGLSDDMRENFGLMKDMGQHTRVDPEARAASLLSLMDKIRKNPDAMKDLEGSGLEFEDNLLRLTGRNLMPETILTYSGKNSYPVGEPDWTKHVRSAKLVSTQNMDEWLLLFAPRDQGKAPDFVKTLQRVARPMGIMVGDPTICALENDRTDTYLRAIKQNIKSTLKMIVCVLTTNRKDRYDAIKKVCCVDNPVPSQCIIGRTISKPQMMMSVCTKVAIQLNCKMGGEVWAVEIPMKRGMVVGFDTYHDSVNKGQSVGGFVASVNPTFTRYTSRVTFHHTGQELWDQLGTCMTACLKAYQDENGGLPEKIIFYRDGVGTGQLAAVKEHEINQLKACFEAIYPQGVQPQFVFIVVTKRITTRLKKYTEQGKLRNPDAGTVVDTEITRPYSFDFFLVSQSVRQGTVSPTYYNVIEDNSSLKVDHIQRLTYKLTHLYYNWPGTIRVPAPCQYAHKLAFLVGQSIHTAPSRELCNRLFFL